jgi:hypothetical protein
VELRFLLAFIHYTGEFVVTILIGWHCTLVRLLPPSLPCDCLLIPLRAIARGFTTLFHVCI